MIQSVNMTGVELPVLPCEPGPRRWTREEFYRLGELGFFDGQRVELLEGELMVQSPQNWPHTAAVTRVFQLFQQHFGSTHWVRMQLPLSLGPSTEPEPDVSIVPGQFEDYSSHPSHAVLVVEVSDTTLALDRGRKVGVYASAGVPEYWVLDIRGKELWVHREPVAEVGTSLGWCYSQVERLGPTGVVTPLIGPSVAISVQQLLG